jgi:hypothetical protein
MPINSNYLFVVNMDVDADKEALLDPVSYCPLVHEAPQNSSL